MPASIQTMRQVSVVMLVAALALLALRPLCGLAFAGGTQADCARLWSVAGLHAAGHAGPTSDSSAECRRNINDATLVKSGELPAPWIPDQPPAAALLAFAGLLLFAGWRKAVRLRLTDPPERSFYVRSARILR